jgi:hypothetical protein
LKKPPEALANTQKRQQIKETQPGANTSTQKPWKSTPSVFCVSSGCRIRHLSRPSSFHSCCSFPAPPRFGFPSPHGLVSQHPSRPAGLTIQPPRQLAVKMDAVDMGSALYPVEVHYIDDVLGMLPSTGYFCAVRKLVEHLDANPEHTPRIVE